MTAVTIQSNKIASNEGKDNQALKPPPGNNQTNFLANAMHPRAWDACGHLPSTAPGGAFTLLASMVPTICSGGSEVVLIYLVATL